MGLLVDRCGLDHHRARLAIRDVHVSDAVDRAFPLLAMSFVVTWGTLVRACQGIRCWRTASRKMRMCVPWLVVELVGKSKKKEWKGVP